MRPRVEDGAPVPDISRREITTFGVMVERAMEQLPRAVVDLSNEETRAQIAEWLSGVIRHNANEMEWAFRRAVDSALSQAVGLMADPKRYERQSANRKKQREKFKAEREQDERNYAARKKEREDNLRALADEGKLVPMKGYVLNLPCCTDEPEKR